MISRDVAHEISGATLSHLKTFVNKSMLQVNSSTGKYYLHELFRQNAYLRLNATADHELIHQAHFDYFRNYVDHADSAELISLINDLRAALEWGIAKKKVDELLDFCGDLYQFWRKVGYMQEGLDWLAQTLDMIEDVSTEKHAVTLKYAGNIAFTLGQNDMSRKYLNEAYYLARTLQAEDIIFKVALELASICTFETKLEEAEHILQENLRLGLKSENSAVILSFLGNLGILASDRQDHKKAIHYYTEALSIAESIDDEEGLSHILINLGVSHLKQNNYETAQAYLKRSLTIACELDDLQLQIIALANLSETFFLQSARRL